MKYKVLVFLLGANIGLLPGLGAMATQFDGVALDKVLNEVEIQEVDYQWEQIPVEYEEVDLQSASVVIDEIVRTRHDDVKTRWWEVDGVVPNNPNVPDEFEFWCVVIGYEYDLCPELLMSMCKVESEFTADAKRGQYTGCMQVGTKVHSARIEKLGYTADQMTEIEPCIRVAADYLTELLEKCDGDIAAALLMYNGNTKGLYNYYRTGYVAYYARRVLELSAQYERENRK